MGGSAVRLRRQIPYTAAAEILLTGRHLTAPEAKELGLIGHVVPDGEALAKARELAAMIVANGPLAVEAILRTLRETEHMSEAEAFEWEQPLGMAVMGSEDAKEGPRARSRRSGPRSSNAVSAKGGTPARASAVAGARADVRRGQRVSSRTRSS